MWGRIIARLIYGTPLAVCPRWRAADRVHRQAQRRHGKSAELLAVKRARVHAALEPLREPR